MIGGVTRVGGFPGLSGRASRITQHTLKHLCVSNLTPRNTTLDAFMNKYIRVQELIFRLSRDVSLGRLCSNSLIASATTTSRNLTPAPQGCKIKVFKRVSFFDHG